MPTSWAFAPSGGFTEGLFAIRQERNMKRHLRTCAVVGAVVFLGCAGDGGSTGTTTASGGTGGSAGSGGADGGGKGGMSGDGGLEGDGGFRDGDSGARDGGIDADGSVGTSDGGPADDGGKVPPGPLTQTLLNAIGASTQVSFTVV